MTDSKPLDLDGFEELLDVHGADPARWPPALEPRARALLESSDAAQQALARAQRVAVLLDAVPDLLPSAELSARIAALPARHPQGWAAWWPFGNPLAPLLAWGAAAAFGLFLGSGFVPGLEALDESSVNGGAESAAERAAAEAGEELPSAEDAEGEDWSELELALGLGWEWEDEP